MKRTLTAKVALYRYAPLVFRLLYRCLRRFGRQTYLLGYEFPSTLMLLGKGKIHFVVSASKGEAILFFPDLVE